MSDKESDQRMALHPSPQNPNVGNRIQLSQLNDIESQRARLKNIVYNSNERRQEIQDMLISPPNTKTKLGEARYSNSPSLMHRGGPFGQPAPHVFSL
jgi:hypothetical protein